MLPANRHAPRRAKSSTSDYSVTEFLADFPDDAGCLDYLWRTRHASDGEHAHCPKCDGVKVFERYATKQQSQSAWRFNHRWNDQRSMFHALVREAAQQ